MGVTTADRKNNQYSGACSSVIRIDDTKEVNKVITNKIGLEPISLWGSVESEKEMFTSCSKILEQHISSIVIQFLLEASNYVNVCAT